MNDGRLKAMAEATRLTRAGRLHEAAALIQQMLQRRFTPEAPDLAVNEPAEVKFKLVEPTRRLDQSAAQPPKTPFRPEGASARHRSAPLKALDQSLLNRLKKSISKPKLDPSNPEVEAGGRFIEDSFTHQAGTRTYKLYIPSGYRGQALPLVVLLHGCTQGPDDFAAGTRMNVLAEREPFFVLYPEQATSANPSRCWNWFKASDQRRGEGEPALIADLTRQVVRTYRLDERRVYVAGLSAGGAMAMVMGVTYPDVYAAIGVHSGLPYAAAHDLPSAFAAMQQGQANPGLAPSRKLSDPASAIQPVPAIVFHGDRDTTVHPGNGDQVLVQWTKAYASNGWDTGTKLKLRMTEERGQVPQGHAYTRARYQALDGQTVLERWQVHGAGHAWSGGSPKGSYTDSQGPDASEAMVRFFLRHAQQNTSSPPGPRQGRRD